MTQVGVLNKEQKELLTSELHRVLSMEQGEQINMEDESIQQEIINKQNQITVLGRSLIKKYKQMDEKYQQEAIIQGVEKSIEEVSIILTYGVVSGNEDYKKVLHRLAHIGYIISSVNAKELSEKGTWGEEITFDSFSRDLNGRVAQQ